MLGGAGEYFRVQLPDGHYGYVASRLTEPADQPFASQVVASAEPVHARPASEAPVMSRLDVGTEVPVLGRFAGYLYVRSPDGLTGWLPAAAQQ